MTTATAIQKILKSPHAFQHLDAMKQALVEETEKRKAFYEWIDENTKAEFIAGEIVVHSPVSGEHWKTTDLLSRIVSFYSSFKKLGRVGVEKVMISLTHNDYEPDIVFFKKEKADTFTQGQVLFPAPDFVVEILSKKTAKTHKTIKKADYAAHGVKEYWIIDSVKQTIEQYILLKETDTEYFLPYIHSIDDDITSRMIEGFSIPVRAIFDEAANVEALAQLMKM